MATHRAISSACRAVIELLRADYNRQDFNNDLEFEVYLADNFSNPMNAGVSLFLYRVFHNGAYRIPPGRLAPNGQRFDTQMPLDLHFMLTAWASDASLQHEIVGWVMRTIEDTPILPAGFLNQVAGEVFQADETLEIAAADISTEDLLHIWETLIQDRYQLSIPYIARNIRIESTRVLESGRPVQRRVFDYSQLDR